MAKNASGPNLAANTSMMDKKPRKRRSPYGWRYDAKCEAFETPNGWLLLQELVEALTAITDCRIRGSAEIRVKMPYRS
jgi:hypothetical protein